MSKLWFVAGAAVGYVLGARAGRESYERISRSARQFWENPTVQEAAGVVRAQTSSLANTAKSKVTEKTQKATDKFDGAMTDAQTRINSM
jgi:hypothetical protein